MKCVSLDRLLKGTNWAGAPACVILVGEIDAFIARLYNKAERAMTRDPVESPTSSPAQDSLELAGEAAAELARPPDPAVLDEDKRARCIHGLLLDQDCDKCHVAQLEDEKEPYS